MRYNRLCIPVRGSAAGLWIGNTKVYDGPVGVGTPQWVTDTMVVCNRELPGRPGVWGPVTYEATTAVWRALDDQQANFIHAGGGVVSIWPGLRTYIIDGVRRTEGIWVDADAVDVSDDGIVAINPHRTGIGLQLVDGHTGLLVSDLATHVLYDDAVAGRPVRVRGRWIGWVDMAGPHLRTLADLGTELLTVRRIEAINLVIPVPLPDGKVAVIERSGRTTLRMPDSTLGLVIEEKTDQHSVDARVIANEIAIGWSTSPGETLNSSVELRIPVSRLALATADLNAEPELPPMQAFTKPRIMGVFLFDGEPVPAWANLALPIRPPAGFNPGKMETIGSFEWQHGTVGNFFGALPRWTKDGRGWYYNDQVPPMEQVYLDSCKSYEFVMPQFYCSDADTGDWRKRWEDEIIRLKQAGKPICIAAGAHQRLVKGKPTVSLRLVREGLRWSRDLVEKYDLHGMIVFRVGAPNITDFYGATTTDLLALKGTLPSLPKLPVSTPIEPPPPPNPVDPVHPEVPEMAAKILTGTELEAYLDRRADAFVEVHLKDPRVFLGATGKVDRQWFRDHVIAKQDEQFRVKAGRNIRPDEAMFLSNLFVDARATGGNVDKVIDEMIDDMVRLR